MKHAESTLKTKRALAASLKRLLEKTPLSKITVSAIIADSNVNRKTFYYHFEDVYALLQWMFENEVNRVTKQLNVLADYEQSLLFAIEYVEQNKYILNCLYDSMGRDELKRFFYADFIESMTCLADVAEAYLGVKADDEYKAFLAEFYTEALLGIIVTWFREDKARDKEKIIKYIENIFKVTFPSIIAQK